MSYSVFLSSKLPALKGAIEATKEDADKRIEGKVYIHMGLARQSRASRKLHPTRSGCVVVQLAKALAKKCNIPLPHLVRATWGAEGLVGSVGTSGLPPATFAARLASLRSPLHAVKENLFEAKFRDYNERGQTVDQRGLDYGGLFNELLTMAASDLFREVRRA
jgi:hypothetical protein